jgi:tetratricopeptide (TPR) repeat protein
LEGTPDIQTFFGRWLTLGFSFGEAAYACQRVLSWQTTVVGDPLYSPMAKNPRELHLELLQRESPLIQWSHLRWVDINLAAGAPPKDFIGYLEHQPATATSAVLNEKLGDLYQLVGKPKLSIAAYQQALNLSPSRQQRARLILGLGQKLVAAGKITEALKLYDKFLADSPGYPGAISLYRQMETLARKIGKEEKAWIYAVQIQKLSPE